MHQASQLYNPRYKTYKLKTKLMKLFGNRINFWQPIYRSELMYSDEIQTGQVIETAFDEAASDERRLQEVALLLRFIMKDAYREN